MSDWSSDVCSTDLSRRPCRRAARRPAPAAAAGRTPAARRGGGGRRGTTPRTAPTARTAPPPARCAKACGRSRQLRRDHGHAAAQRARQQRLFVAGLRVVLQAGHVAGAVGRSEERRVGKKGVSTCRTRGSAYHKKKKK